MRYREHAPAPLLAPFVACFWELTGDVEAHRVLPDGAMDVLFAAGSATALVIGPMTRALVTDAGRSGWVAGVRFRPGAAVDVLGFAARELLDDVANAADVWGARGRGLGGQLAEARGPHEALAVLEAELTARAPTVRAPDSRVARAVEVLRAARGELPIPAVAASVGLGERQLERLFQERVGYGPKAFARVVRLHRATAAIEGAGARSRGSTASWARFAMECGYADQAHLIREFRSLAGVTPRVHASERGMSEIDNPP